MKLPAPVTTGEDAVILSPCQWEPTRLESEERLVALLYSCFQRNLKANDRIVMIGEDIEGSYGGAFKVTKTLSQEFPGRVRNTPISEAAIVGLGNGWHSAACCQLSKSCSATSSRSLPIKSLIMRQSSASCITIRLRCRSLIRTPMGGKRGYGPTHSQSIEKHFLGSARYDDACAAFANRSRIHLRSLIRDNRSTDNRDRKQAALWHAAAREARTRICPRTDGRTLSYHASTTRSHAASYDPLLWRNASGSRTRSRSSF